MTTAERINAKAELLELYFAELGHYARHNGAPIGPDSDPEDIAAHVGDIDADNVSKLWKDIGTIDRVKQVVRNFATGVALARKPADLTTDDLLELEVNDDSLVQQHMSWAVVRITKQGTEVLTCGGDYYQRYVVTSSTTTGADGAETINTVYTQEGETDALKAALNAADSAWTAHGMEVSFDGSHPVYSESGIDYYVVPCDLPADLEQLLSICIYRSGGADEPPKNLSYALNSTSCSTSTDGMIGLPHGIWLIYDNSQLATAPIGLLVPKALVDGAQTGIKWDKLEIKYQVLTSGLERLRLVGDGFGDVYVISTQDENLREGTWME